MTKNNVKNIHETAYDNQKLNIIKIKIVIIIIIINKNINFKVAALMMGCCMHVLVI